MLIRTSDLGNCFVLHHVSLSTLDKPWWHHVRHLILSFAEFLVELFDLLLLRDVFFFDDLVFN